MAKNNQRVEIKYANLFEHTGKLNPNGHFLKFSIFNFQSQVQAHQLFLLQSKDYYNDFQFLISTLRK